MAVRANAPPPSTGTPQQLQPDFMDSIMDSPLTQSLFSNPELMRTMMMNNPQTQRLLEQNPELRQVFNDPATMRQMVDMMRNPQLRREMLRNTDRFKANIENVPGGFDALRRFYTDVQEPLMDAFDEPEVLNDAAPTIHSDDANINTQPLPNPWAAPSAQPQNPFGNLMNMFGGNPNAGNLFGSLPGAQPPAGQPNPFANLLGSNPNMLFPPNLFGAANQGGQNQSFQDMLNQSRQQLLNDPQALQQALQQLQTLMGGANQQQPFNLFGPNLFGAAQNANPTQNGNPNQNTSSTQNASPTQNQNQSQADRWRGFAPLNPALQAPEERYAAQLQQLDDMGFQERAKNIQALQRANGNVERALEIILSGEL